MRIVVGTGWWCSGEDDRSVNPERKILGDDEIRGLSFFEKWLQSVDRFVSPSSIVVVDSASPVKPDLRGRTDVAWLSLPFNARHSTNHVGRWSGWMRSVLGGANYAVLAEADYFVYVEQDCLLMGEGIVEHCLRSMRTGLMFGAGRGTPQPIQQSFFIVSKDRLPGFIANLEAITARDCDISPEWKFVFASWRPLVLAANLGLLKSPRAKAWALKFARRFRFDLLPVDGGRTRSFRFSDAHYYFQHGSSEELRLYEHASKERIPAEK